MFVALLLLIASGLSVKTERVDTNPVERVVELIRGLKSKIEADGKTEQRTYDKFACWCEETTARKAAAIEDAKASIESLSKSIVELNGRLGSSGAEIAQLKKDIAETKASIAKAEEMRAKENAEYLKTKGALEQAVGNLKRAIRVLGQLPQQSRKGFINAADEDSPMGDADQAAAAAGLMETNVLTIVAGVRNAMHLYSKNNDVKGDDFSPVKHFLADPASFISTASSSPHKGTYNTQSNAIQGMLAEMKEQMERDLVDNKAEEEEKQSGFDDLHATKTKDKGLLEVTLVKKTKENGDDTKQHAEDSEERKETETQLKTDEAFFETTTDSCKAKADEWAERTRLRTEELAGIGQAVDILTSDDAKAILGRADTTFLQLSSVTKSMGSVKTAYGILKETATKSKSLKIALIAASLSTKGHFDQVMKDIDLMIQALRDEEAADVKHKDWCESERHNANSKNEALEYDMEELQAKVGRLESKKGELNTAIANTETEMSDLQDAMDTALDNRNTENAEFQQALEDDTNAIALIGQAMAALSKFYSNNGLALVEKKKHHKKEDPEYATNPDTAPETFSDGGYGGKKSENTGIVAILGMIKEDLEKEVHTAKADEAASLAAYQKLYDESAATMQALTDKKTSLESDVASTNKEITDTNADHTDADGSKGSTDDYLLSLKDSCDWIMRTFDDRRTARKAEIDGLGGAKSALAGAVAGTTGPGLISTTSVEGKHRTSVQDALRDLDQVESHFETSFLQRRA